MNKNLLSYLAKTSLVIMAFLLLYYFFAGIRTVPWEGDSIDYHIPIARLILSGHILGPAPYINNFMQYCPGASEIILAAFMFLKIPLNIYNVFGLIALYFALKHLGKTFGLKKESAIIFAVSFVILHGVIRWVLAQTIDIWMSVFFALSLALLQKPGKTWKYFLTLGITLGMVLGSKYTGPAYTLFLLLIYGKNLLKSVNLKKLAVFAVPFLLFGLSWYIRNYVLTGDPYFPQSIPFFKGIPWHILDEPVWKMFLRFPKVWFDAFVSEYTVWLLTLPIVIFFAFRQKSKEVVRLSLLGLMAFGVYFFLPSGPYPNLITSGFRYTYAAFIPFILAVFLIAQQLKKEEQLGVVALINMLILPELSYHPKILIALIPIGLAILYPSKIKKLQQLIQKKYAGNGRQF